MRTGLTKTLAVIAIACLGYQAYAIAPVINQIPSPTVTDDANPSSPNFFIYPDAVNLNNYVSDDGDLANIIWSFTGPSAGPSVSRYRLNGAGPLDVAGGDTTLAPPAGKQIAGPAVTHATIAGRNEPYDLDNNPLTVTIRDNTLSPLATGAGMGPYSPAVGAFATETISMYASDGTTVSAKRDWVIYTQQGTNDRLSAIVNPTPVPIHGVGVSEWNFASFTNNWYWDTLSSFGSVTQTSGAGGLCMAVTALGVNVGQWVSPYGSAGIPLVGNSVWRIRATMSTTQTTPGLVPLWDILVQNLNTNPATGAFTAGDLAYTADYMFLDNTGSASAIKGPAAGLNVFDIWYTPPAVRTAAWNTGIVPALGGNKDMRLIFRVLDVAGAGYGGELDAGTVCLQNVAVDKFDMTKEFPAAGNPDVYNLNPVISGINGVSVVNLLADQFGGGPGTGSVLDYSVAPLTITPADPSGWLTELTEITPGDTINPIISNPAYSVGATADNFPIPWTSNTLYEMLVDASAPDALGETNGPDAILMGFSAITNEILADSYMLSGLGRIGMPKQGSPQTYTMLFWGHQPSLLSTPAGGQRLTWRIYVLNASPSYDRPTPPATTGARIARNQGGIRINAVKVRKVGFEGM